MQGIQALRKLDEGWQICTWLFGSIFHRPLIEREADVLPMIDRSIRRWMSSVVASSAIFVQ